MVRNAITKEYFVLITNDKGRISVPYNRETKAGIVIAAVGDLLLNKVISIEKNKISVIRSLPEELEYVADVYTFLNKKPRSVNGLMSEYFTLGEYKAEKVLSKVGESLFAEQKVTTQKAGLFRKRTVYIPVTVYREEIIESIKASAAKDGELETHDMILLALMNKVRKFDLYFSKNERTDIRAKLKESNKNPFYKQVIHMIDYVKLMDDNYNY